MGYRTRIALLLAGLSSGCYSAPPTGEIMVNTMPPGASCVISQQERPLGIAEPTPAIAILTLAAAEIGVTCRRPGFAEAAVRLPPPPQSTFPDFFPSGHPEIGYTTRVDITMTPAAPGAAP